jgi:biofilm PGA synthesis N-glycosyltransferase PgaC
MDAVAFLGSLDFVSLVVLFWYTTLLEVPRYVIGAIAAGIAVLAERPRQPPDTDLTVSVILAGHNEAQSLRACVGGLAEQTLADRGRLQVVVVDDGSTDGMANVGHDLQDEGLVDEVIRLQHRGGKSAAVNLGLCACTGEIIVIADIDTSFDRDALAVMLGYFAADPRLGAVGGDLGVRNECASLVTRCQAIEYGISVSLGRRVADMLGILSIVSGAFGAFRRNAIESVGGQDIEVGEDADLTMKLRRAGWRVQFAPEARALTLVPETVSALIAQRLRWDRGIVTIWLRKYRAVFDPGQSTFRAIDVLASLDVLVFQFFLPLAFPVYLVWLWWHFGAFAMTLLGVTLVGYLIIDLIAVITAAAVRVERPLGLVIYLPLYAVLQLVLRIVRLIAIFQELIFRASYRDPYVPARVMRRAARM